LASTFSYQQIKRIEQIPFVGNREIAAKDRNTIQYTLDTAVDFGLGVCLVIVIQTWS